MTKKTVGIILMIIGGISFLILLAVEVSLFKNGTAPTSVPEWIGNLTLPVISTIIFLVGNKMHKK